MIKIGDDKNPEISIFRCESPRSLEIVEFFQNQNENLLYNSKRSFLDSMKRMHLTFQLNLYLPYLLYFTNAKMSKKVYLAVRYIISKISDCIEVSTMSLQGILI